MEEKIATQENGYPRLWQYNQSQTAKCKCQKWKDSVQVKPTMTWTLRTVTIIPVKRQSPDAFNMTLGSSNWNPFNCLHSQCLTRTNSKYTKWLAYTLTTFFQWRKAACQTTPSTSLRQKSQSRRNRDPSQALSLDRRAALVKYKI